MVSETIAKPKGAQPSVRDSRAWRTWYILRSHPSMIVGILLLAVILFVTVAGPSLVPYKPLKTDPENRLLPPSALHPMGTDAFGRDILSRVVNGARLDLFIAFSVVAIALGIGVAVGMFSGYYGGKVDDVVMRITDVILAFPSFILALAITAILGNSIPNVIIAIAIAYIPYFVRLTRGEVLSAKERDYTEAARCVGNPNWRIIYLHLLPNCLTPALVQATLCLGWAILDASGLAFLGLGIRPPTPEWGVLVSEGSRDIIGGQWWTSFFPGAVIVLTAFAFNLIGDSLRDVTSPTEAVQ
ncbi:MAG: ABC transporter permease [Anaerolineales bacterium]